ncbi:hypothetical protein FB565_006125 [Actinoplanes lutulentus]|uniref:Uncharacterized protein n=1 Tax=Actinoplanes lutulentus TaxID=1287878 RepID=A0A327Z216_9ACTN|nr:hypothetical protein [Actinoplanes lutulentus]MBB2946357.1 hypothetical protein [Actinoplanes lutulentus]RAK28703.1 hypothetical protein B0I29_11940 [Actinoplanes lutulentus]
MVEGKDTWELLRLSTALGASLVFVAAAVAVFVAGPATPPATDNAEALTYVVIDHHAAPDQAWDCPYLPTKSGAPDL